MPGWLKKKDGKGVGVPALLETQCNVTNTELYLPVSHSGFTLILATATTPTSKTIILIVVVSWGRFVVAVVGGGDVDHQKAIARGVGGGKLG